MAYEKQIKEEIQDLEGLRTLTDIYGEIASVRMKKIRESVLYNREFLNAIHGIFKEVLASYAEKFEEEARAGKITFLSHNGKTVATFISANTGFYGEVVQQVFREFIKEARKGSVEVTIVGRLGLSLLKQVEPNMPYTYFDLPDYGINKNQLDQIIRHLVQYEEIHVYYGKYQNLVRQLPTMYNISAGTFIKEAEKETTKYLFEPSIEEILMFFEAEIFASLFDQSVRESQLAKFASRMMAMDTANENIEKKLTKVRLEKLRAGHRQDDKRQLDALASVYKL
jgi:ATP synthase F1 gamma subunit